MRLFLRCFREGNVHVDAVVMLRTFDNENVKEDIVTSKMDKVSDCTTYSLAIPFLVQYFK